MKKLLYPILMLLCLCSCISDLQKRGYAFNLSDHQLLQEGVTSKETVLKIMGSPTIISDLTNQESWIYYAEDVEKFLFFIPEIKARTVFVIRFDETDTLKNLQKFDLANENKSLRFASHYTKIDGHKTGLFKSIFSNIGQVKPQ